MIVLFTDYGINGPYLGQVEAVLQQYAPGERVINLLADVPRQDPRSGAYLLAAYSQGFPRGTIFFCVVDPGVGSGKDIPVVIKQDGHWFVGPHNGLFDIVTRREVVQCWEITWKPEGLSDTFHGRDLYAPVCAMIVKQQPIPGRKMEFTQRHAWPDDLHQVVYIDHFGNAITGIRANQLQETATLAVGEREIRHAHTFAAVGRGEPFWYANANGLIEIAVNRGSAAEVLKLRPGSEIDVVY